MASSDTPVTIPVLQQMKRDGKKSVGFVAWDYQIALIAERAGADFVSVGDSVGVNLWGHSNPLEVTVDEILVCCKAVRRALTRTLLSCDIPFGPVQEGVDSALRAAIRIVKEGGADMVKVDAASDFPAVVKAVKIPVIGGFGGGPWLDGRVRLAHTAIGYAARWIDSKSDTYFNGAKATLTAFEALIADARAGKQ